VSILGSSFLKTLQLDGTSLGSVILGPVANGLNTVSLTKANASTWTLYGSNTFSGATAISKGSIVLAGTNGAFAGTSGITLSGNAVLELRNSALTNSADRLRDAAGVTLSGGTLSFAHAGGAADYSERLGALSVAASSNTFATSQADFSRTSVVTIASLTFTPGATIDFVGEGLGASDRNRIIIPGYATGPIGPWATVNGTNLAAYSSTLGVYEFGTSGSDTITNLAARGNVPNSVVPDNASALAQITEPGESGPITLEGSWTNRIFMLAQNNPTDAVVDVVSYTTNKTLLAATLAIAPDQGSLTIGTAPGNGYVAPLTAGGALRLENDSTNSLLTINAAVANNTSASSITKFGGGTAVLAGSNTFSGSVAVNEGTLEFGGPFGQRISNVFSGAGALAKSGTNQLHVLSANTYTGPTYIKEGTVRANDNATFGTTNSPVYITDGGTLNIGCTPDVLGTRTLNSINFGNKQFIISGAGYLGQGAIINISTAMQYNAFGRIALADNATIGGPQRIDMNSVAPAPALDLNDHTLTKTGACEFAIHNVQINPGAEGKVVVNQGLLRFETGSFVNGTTNNTVTVSSGGKLEMYQLNNASPSLWSVIVNEGSFFQGAGGQNVTNQNIWNGPITLNGCAFFNAGATPTHWTVNGDISGTGKLVKMGGSPTVTATLWLYSTNNTYSGGTIVSNGTLYVKYPASLPGYNDGRLTVAGGGTLAVHASDGSIGFTAEQIRDLHTNSSFKAVNALLSIDTASASLDYPYDLPKLMGVAKQGTNSLSLGGANTNLGNIAVYAGLLTLSGSNVQQNATCYLEGSPVSNALLRITSTGSLCSSNNFSIRNNGALYLDGGSMLRLPDTADGETFGIGYNVGGYGYLKMSDGSLTTTRLYPGRDGVGVVRFSGGAARVNHHIHIGRTAAAWGSVTIDGSAAVSQPFAAAECFMAYEGGRGELNIAGGTFTRASTQIDFGNSVGSSTSVVNLCAGKLTTRTFNYITGKAWINFCGATLSAVDTLSPYIPSSTNLLVHSFGPFGSFAGGAVIDSNGKDITIPAVIRNPTGKGVAAIDLSSNGLGYIGEPFVSIEGGSGTGATAIANLAYDGTGRGTFKIVSLTVTCPGMGYASAPNVVFKGGGAGVVTAQVASVTLADNTSGGLTKLGAGTLTLSAANTYTGATTIAAGTLKLGTAAALMPNTPIVLAGGTLDLGGFTVTNVISGAGSVSNGTISTVFSPAGEGALGTNTLALSSLSVKGTYVADVTAGGDCDRLSVQGSIDLSNIDLQIVNTAALDRSKVYTILSCTGTRSGTFKSTNLPDSRWHVLYRADGSVQLIFVNGTLLRVR
jgi:autotransporter-associated beta strand protein